MPSPTDPADIDQRAGTDPPAVVAAAENLPFNVLVGLSCDEVSPGRAVVALPADERLTNHIGSVHAVAELAPAEAAGGIAAVTGLSDLVERGYLPVARSLSVDYRRLAHGALTAVAELSDEIASDARRAADADERVAFTLPVDVRDGDGIVAEVGIEYVFARFDGRRSGA